MRPSANVSQVTPPTYLAKVKNGRLVLDEPTDLPEGEVVELGEELDPELLAELDASLAELDAGCKGMDADEFIAQLRSKPR
jgi:hypothetical protein